ncbi:hypothetical protein JTE90_003796 [Oedothorax gibbosus]|uniref:Uncharacterized protein n=1 Tax=Oedothorax gibbosus TaxID=931172 RepID=A0AAV6VA51_9ARAC|nr:hypothetical protein JTE90_003796 [Oedothorax gibbosus]
MKNFFLINHIGKKHYPRQSAIIIQYFIFTLSPVEGTTTTNQQVHHQKRLNEQQRNIQQVVQHTPTSHQLFKDSRQSQQLATSQETDDEGDNVRPSLLSLKTREYSNFPSLGRSPGRRKILIDLRLREVAWV